MLLEVSPLNSLRYQARLGRNHCFGFYSSYCDVGFPSVCYEYTLLPLVVKEAVSANDLVE